MNELDIKILTLLQKNSRISISEMSAQVNLSISATSDRLRKLESSGIISQYTAILNPEVFNKTLMAIMFVSLENPNFTDMFLAFVHDQEEILECHYLAGNFDYALKIVTKNTASLEAILYKIKSVTGIQKTETNVVLSTVKNQYSILPTN
ncbi:MAG: Lrp/AsnC family transcriptional regulator [Firmicutes bacterium HGW-Firmicutes-1]|jgi:Lrp/AsnC family leucine-responsive transcriptional regulator|nr:MAG: Lrp/AsnC family transcriptional regulator [Firmicutes bacterium HGW-Firmicutes-1]